MAGFAPDVTKGLIGIAVVLVLLGTAFGVGGTYAWQWVAARVEVHVGLKQPEGAGHGL